MKHTLQWWLDQASTNPQRLARSLFQTIESLTPELRRAVIAWTPREADLADSIRVGTATGGPLAGLPYALKDLFDVAGAPTRAGSSFLPEVRPAPNQDSQMVQRLASQGAAMAAKVATVEFAYGLTGENAWYGDVPHPRIPTALAGGSSSGSAWAVAAGLTPFGIGTDTAGSIRVPAAYCGLYAWRDAPGPLVARGCVPLAPSFDTPGWFAADPETLLRINEALGGPSGAANCPRILDLTALSPNLSPALKSAGQRLLEAMGAVREQDAEQLAREAFADSTRAYNIQSTLEIFEVHRAWLDHYRERYDPVVWQRIDRARHWSTEELAWGRAKEAQILAAWDALFARYDAVALPVTPIPSPGKADMTEDFRSELLSLTTPGSFARCPALTIPLRLPDDSSGGLQLLMPRQRAWGLSAGLLRHAG